MSEPIEYDMRMVALLDVLGWSDATNRSVRDDDLRSRMAIALEPHEPVTIDGKPVTWGQPVISQFSDSVILSFDISPGERADEDSFYFHLCRVCDQCSENGFFIRGACTMGLMYHRPAIAFGPALVEAVKLEKSEKTAIYPRIIFGWEDSDDPYPVLRKSKEDGIRFFDFLKYHPVLGTDTREEWVRGELIDRNNARRVTIVKRHPELPPLRHEELPPPRFHDLG